MDSAEGETISSHRTNVFLTILKNFLKIKFWYLLTFFGLNGSLNRPFLIIKGQKNATVFVSQYKTGKKNPFLMFTLKFILIKKASQNVTLNFLLDTINGALNFSKLDFWWVSENDEKHTDSYGKNLFSSFALWQRTVQTDCMAMTTTTGFMTVILLTNREKGSNGVLRTAALVTEWKGDISLWCTQPAVELSLTLVPIRRWRLGLELRRREIEMKCRSEVKIPNIL